MDPASAERVRVSFEQIRPRLDQAVEAFLASLERSSPDIRTYFRSDPLVIRNHLVTALGLVCQNAAKPQPLRPAMAERGARHWRLGVGPDQYARFREHMLDALASAAGSEWSEKLQRDWSQAIDEAIGAMRPRADR
jgi:hemoglobin-like flavoprotein